MKNVIGYTRISSEDQSNFSLTGQESSIIKYCQQQNWNLVEIFKEDGQSAKNFDRIIWKDLVKYVKLNHKSIDYLLVMKYDRFSRNLELALNAIHNLENKLGIRVVSVMEPIGLSPDSPLFFQMRTQFLLNAHVELLVIRDRTKFGIHHAAKAGRWCRAAPFGYINARDENNKPIIVVNEKHRDTIKKCYQLYSNGIKETEIKKRLKDKLPYRGNGKIIQMLKCPVYGGFVKVTEYMGEPEHLVNGIHERIIEPDLWWKVQKLINVPKKEYSRLSEQTPLRGVIRCHDCHKLMTSSKSKGKYKYYWYYECSKCRANMNANKMHEQLRQIIDECSLTLTQVNYITSSLKDKLKTFLADENKNLIAIDKEIKSIGININLLEEKYITNKIDKDVYNKWNIIYKADLHSLESQKANKQLPITQIWDKYKKEIFSLNNLSMLFDKASTLLKHEFIKIVFGSHIYYKDGIYRTPYILKLFIHKINILKNKKLLLVENHKNDLGSKEDSAPKESPTELISVQLLHWIKTVIAA